MRITSGPRRPRSTKQVLFTNHASNEIGLDCSLGVQWRPLLTDNVIVTAGSRVLCSGTGLQGYLSRQHRAGSRVSAGAHGNGGRLSLQRNFHGHADVLSERRAQEVFAAENAGLWTFRISHPLCFLPNERDCTGFHFRLWSADCGSTGNIGYASIVAPAPQLDRSDPSPSRSQEHRMQSVSPRHRADAFRHARGARLHRLPWRQSCSRPNERAGAHSSAQQGVLENIGQSTELKRLAQPRIARVHPLHQSRRSARGGAGLRTLPRRDHSATSITA